MDSVVEVGRRDTCIQTEAEGWTLGLGWEEGRATAHGYGVSVGDDGTVLDLDNGKGAYCCWAISLR